VLKGPTEVLAKDAVKAAAKDAAKDGAKDASVRGVREGDLVALPRSRGAWRRS
jgi:hypothetical protein